MLHDGDCRHVEQLTWGNSSKVNHLFFLHVCATNLSERTWLGCTRQHSCSVIAHQAIRNKDSHPSFEIKMTRFAWFESVKKHQELEHH